MKHNHWKSTCEVKPSPLQIEDTLLASRFRLMIPSVHSFITSNTFLDEKERNVSNRRHPAISPYSKATTTASQWWQSNYWGRLGRRAWRRLEEMAQETLSPGLSINTRRNYRNRVKNLVGYLKEECPRYYAVGSKESNKLLFMVHGKGTYVQTLQYMGVYYSAGHHRQGFKNPIQGSRTLATSEPFTNELESTRLY